MRERKLPFFGYTFLNGALTLGILANSYSMRFYIRNMVKICFRSKCQCIREKVNFFTDHGISHPLKDSNRNFSCARKVSVTHHLLAIL